jgi:hypothetical protein
VDGKIRRWRVGGLGIGNCVGHVVTGASLIFCGDFSMVATSFLSTRKHSLVFLTTLLRTNVFGPVVWLRRVLRLYICDNSYAQHDTHYHQVSFRFTHAAHASFHDETTLFTLFSGTSYVRRRVFGYVFDDLTGLLIFAHYLHLSVIYFAILSY